MDSFEVPLDASLFQIMDQMIFLSFLEFSHKCGREVFPS